MMCVPCSICLTAYISFIIALVFGFKKLNIKIKDKNLKGWL